MKIGDFFEGGIVFHVDDTGQHGLIAAKEDQQDASWEEALQNCAACREGGYNDWRLPSKEELNLLYHQKSVVGGFVEFPYWSSTEDGRYDAWNQYFGNGDQYSDDKYYTLGVRALRSFPRVRRRRGASKSLS